MRLILIMFLKVITIYINMGLEQDWLFLCDGCFAAGAWLIY